MERRELLEPDALRAFAVFAEHRNFTTAASRLHISQPSLHVKIRKLAASLGTELYERDGRRLTLTSAGVALAAFALDSRRRLDDFMRELDAGPGPVTIAAGRGALRWVIAGAIQATSRQGHRVQVLAAGREEALVAGRADLAVIAHDPPPHTLSAAEIAAYRQVLMVHSGHPLAARRWVRLANLDGLDLVVPPAGRPHRSALDRALLDAGVAWRPAAEVDGWDLLVHLACLGIGATVVNGCVPAPDGMRAVPVTDLPTVRYWAVWRPQRQAAVAGVLDHLRRRHP
jgi:LysR family transcriptional regulator, low CO2-responsive transcriptional regulator